MLELENVCHPTLENNRDCAFDWLVCLITCCCERTCRTNRFAGRTKTKINITTIRTQ
jgi:hypothetical protein